MEGVPVLLPQNAQERFAKPEAFKQFRTSFYYVTHYQTDAEAFDYFEIPESAAERHENRRLHEAIMAETPGTTKRILDVGCGNAWVAQHYCPRGVAVFSIGYLNRQSRQSNQKLPFRLTFRCGGRCVCPPLSRRYLRLYHCRRDHRTRTRSSGVYPLPAGCTQPGGTLIVTTPYNEKIVYTLCIHCNRPTPMHAHLHAFGWKANSWTYYRAIVDLKPMLTLFTAKY